MKPAGFTAFLKLLELSDHLRKTELKKKLGGSGGFQYWRPLQLVAKKAILPAANIEVLRAEIDRLCSGVQRKYNQNGFSGLARWTKGQLLGSAPDLPVIDVPFGDSGLIVRIKPDFSFEKDDQLYSMSLWATTKPLLSTASLSTGLLLCSNAYRESSEQNYRHLILDTVTNRLFREEDILPTTPKFLIQKIEAFKADIASLTTPPKAGPDSPADRPGVPR